MDDIRVRLRRNGNVVDAEVRAAFPCPPRRDQLDEEQALMVAGCVALEQNEGGEFADWTPITSSSPFVKIGLRYPKKRKGERQLAIGRASTTLDCSPLEALAWWFDFASRERTKISVEEVRQRANARVHVALRAGASAPQRTFPLSLRRSKRALNSIFLHSAVHVAFYFLVYRRGP